MSPGWYRHFCLKIQKSQLTVKHRCIHLCHRRALRYSVLPHLSTVRQLLPISNVINPWSRSRRQINKPTSQTQSAVELSCRGNHCKLLLHCSKAWRDVPAKDHWRGPVQTNQNWLVQAPVMGQQTWAAYYSKSHLLTSSSCEKKGLFCLGFITFRCLPKTTDRNLAFTFNENYIHAHTHFFSYFTLLFGSNLQLV